MDDIPFETHPNWQRLINGNLQLSSTAVGLRMLLQRIRKEISSNPTETTTLAGIRLLRQYFIKNQSAHREDIDILNGNSQEHHAETISRTKPGNHRGWCSGD